MFIESVQSSLESVSIIVNSCSKDNKLLPVSTSTDTTKCLDFDFDKVTFTRAKKSPCKVAQVNPSKKTWLEVMNMV